MTENTAIAPFAAFVADLDGAAVREEVRHAARRVVVDWFAATLPGGAVAPATLLRQAFADQLGRGGAKLYPGGEITDARTAALINGAASHTIEFDDIFRDGIYHPGVPVVSAALALAQAKGLSGAALLDGVIAGYEVSNRLAAAANPQHYTYWHTTGTIGTFGAAAACAKLLGLDAGQTAHALANAATLAAGLQQAFRGDAMSKPMHGGHAAETGVMLALAAEQGVTGVLSMLDGERGFNNAMCEGAADFADAASTLGGDWTITRMTVKNHAACGHAHAAIDAALALQQEHGFEASDVKEVRVGSYAQAVEITGGQHPTTVFEAKFSLPYCVAVGLATGSVRMAAFEDAPLNDPDILDLATRVSVTEDPDCAAAFPTKRSATVTIELADGRTFERHAPTRRGDPDSPLSDAELADKFSELAAPLLGAEASAALLDTLWSLDRLDDVTALATPAKQAAE